MIKQAEMIDKHTANALNQGAILITPNRRLAAAFRLNYDQFQCAKGSKMWPSAQIMPLSSWLTNYWLEFTDRSITPLPTLLTSQQELMLWENIIAASPQAEFIWQTQATAKLVQKAWQLMCAWGIDYSSNEFVDHEDSKAMQLWANAFVAHCEKQQLLEPAGLTRKLIELISKNPLFIHQHIIFTCFDEITPQIKQLIDCLNPHCKIEFVEPQEKSSTCQRISLQNTEKELTTMVKWALHQTQQSHSRKNIACVIPQLSTHRQKLIRLFDIYQQNSAEKYAVNVSMGIPLSEYPIIASALNILSLNHSQYPLDKLSQLLLSPFIGAAEEEAEQRALLDSALHEIGEFEIDLDTLLFFSNKREYRCQKLKIQIESFQSLKQSKKHFSSEWSAIFSEQLFAIGWPGERGLNSEEYQLVQRFNKLLSEFSAFDAISGEINFTAAKKQLQQLANNTVFQTESVDDAPIQILGILEAEALQFDALWVMGLDDENWPQTANPNPYIPLRLQRALGIPHADAARELQFSERVTQRFVHSAEHVIFSTGIFNKDCELRPSSLIRKLPEIHEADLQIVDFPHPQKIIFAAKDLENYDDDFGPEIETDKTIKGGTFIFKEQAACPFRAFANLRLNASSLASPEFGLSALDRGSVIHEVLATVWKKLKSQAQLNALSHEKLAQLVTDCIDKTLKEFIDAHSTELNRAFFQLEKKRTLQLVLDWLAYEKSRAPFAVVACETSMEATVANIDIHVRLDRIDECESGERIIIDYKTGKTAISDYFGDRPNEPQLPIYALNNPDVSGIAFAQLRKDDMRFKGVTKYDSEFPGSQKIDAINDDNVAKDWAEQLQAWEKNFTELAKEYTNAYAAVAPKYPVKTCEMCDYQALCRINERE